MMQLMCMGMFECVIFLTRHGHGDDNAIIIAIAVASIGGCILGFVCHEIHDAVVRFPQTPCAQPKC